MEQDAQTEHDYEPPAATIVGTVAALTAGKSGPGADGMSGADAGPSSF